MTAEQAKKLAAIVRAERLALNLSMRQVAAISGVPVSSVSDLEAGAVLTPQPNTIQAIAEAIATPVSDLYAAAGWLPADELPSFRPYMRAKYRNLPPDAITELNRYLDDFARRYGLQGPLHGQDETNQ
jgi:transcriptional regulator with XRE-family HTH domain